MKLGSLYLLFMPIVLAMTLPGSASAQTRISLQMSVDFSKATPLQKSVYGVNNEFIHTPYTPNFENYKAAYTELGKPTFRYPGGTGANFLNLSTGFATGWEGMDAGLRERKNGFNSALERSGKGKSGVDVQDFIRFMQEEKPVCNFVLNMSSVSLAENKRVLEKIKENGVALNNFELGNELFYAVYQSAFPDVKDYILHAKKTSKMVRNVFPDAKIAVCVPAHYFTKEIFLEGPADKANREERWYRGLQKEDFYDAIAVHLYADVGMDGKTTKLEFLPFLASYQYALSHADSRTQSAFDRMKADFPDREIWLTEYHVGGFRGDLRQYRLRYTFLGGLYNADFLLKMLANPQITLSNWHSMMQFLDYRKPTTGNLLPSQQPFERKVNYDFLKMFGEPLSRSTQYVPVALPNITKYQATGEFRGAFPEVDAGIFYNEKTRAGYLMLVNKQSHGYRLPVGEMEQALQGKVQGGSELAPDATLPLEAALASENAKSLRSISPRKGAFEVKPIGIKLSEKPPQFVGKWQA